MAKDICEEVLGDFDTPEPLLNRIQAQTLANYAPRKLDQDKVVDSVFKIDMDFEMKMEMPSKLISP